MGRPFARTAHREEEVIRERYPIYMTLPCQKVETMRPLDDVIQEIVHMLQRMAGNDLMNPLNLALHDG